MLVLLVGCQTARIFKFNPETENKNYCISKTSITKSQKGKILALTLVSIPS